MPFSIFCHGNDNFHLGYSRVPVMGDVYEIRTAMGRLTTAGTHGIAAEVRGAVGDAVTEAVTGPDEEADEYSERLMRRYDSISGLYAFRQGVDFALMGMGSLRIALSARAEGLIWNDSAFASTTLYTDDADPAEILLAAIHPALETAGLNCAGVLGHIGAALSAFSAWPCAPFGNEAPARYLLNLDLARL